MRLHHWLLALAATLLLCSSQMFGGEQQQDATAPASAPAAAEAVTAETCGDCHDQTASLARGPHSALDSAGLAPLHGATSSCTACHGDPTLHLEEGGGEGTIFAFADDDLPMVKSSQCLTCHSDAHPGFFASHHAAAGLDCTSCHSIHANDGSRALLKPSTAFPDPGLDSVSATCQGCHGDVFATFEFNERHRLREGVLSCASCHDPHAAPTRARLGGFKQEACTDCHADKGGPFVFEHGGQRVEGCVACHDPHGSPNRHMLTFQSTADLCYSCHVTVPGFHSRFTPATVCTNCHSTIHGSNFDPFFLK